MRVKHLFYVTALTATATQLLGPGGLTIAFCIASGWAFVFFASDQHGRQNRVGRLVIAGIVVFLLLLLLLPAVEMPREAIRRMQCRNNISAIVLTLHYYEAKYKTLPPAVTYDSHLSAIRIEDTCFASMRCRIGDRISKTSIPAE